MMTMIPPTLTVIILPSILFFLFSMISIQSIKDREKLSAFECGFDPSSKARIPFSMRFFLLAILFLIFDIEIMFLLPLPILASYSPLSSFYLSGSIFIIIVSLGLFHEWNEGSLEWSN